MNITINKRLSITLSIIYTTLMLFGMPLLLWILSIKHGVTHSNDIIFSIFIVNLKFVVSFLTSLIIGLWLYHASNKLNLDKWTWLLIGLIYGIYSLVFFLVIILLQNVRSEFKLHKSIVTILLLIIVSYGIKLLSDYLIEFHANISLMQKLYNDEITVFVDDFKFYYSFLKPIESLFIIISNVVFSIIMFMANKGNRFMEKLIWLISTLILGLLPVIIYHQLMIIKNKNNAI